MIIWRFGLDWPKTRQKLDDIVVRQNLVLLLQNQIHSGSNSGKFIFYSLVISIGCSKLGCITRCSNGCGVGCSIGCSIGNSIGCSIDVV